MRVAAAASARVEKWFSHLKIVVAEREPRRARKPRSDDTERRPEAAYGS
jgi:hypothetical protein